MRPRPRGLAASRRCRESSQEARQILVGLHLPYHLAVAVDEEDPRDRQPAPGVQHLTPLLADDRVREAVVPHVPLRITAEVICVDADEGDPVAVYARVFLQALRLVGARVTPGREK